MIVRTYQTESARARRASEPAAVEPVSKKRPHKRWSDDCVAFLDDCIARNLTLGQAALKMGRTRNSVIGFYWRRRNR